MSTTVREALDNAQIFLGQADRLGMYAVRIAKAQLDNALTALDNGMSLDDVIQESMFDKVKVKP